MSTSERTTRCLLFVPTGEDVIMKRDYIIDGKLPVIIRVRENEQRHTFHDELKGRNIYFRILLRRAIPLLFDWVAATNPNQVINIQIPRADIGSLGFRANQNETNPIFV